MIACHHRLSSLLAVVALAVAGAPAAVAAPVIGQPAPAFSAVGSDGKTYTLSEFKGKTVVLEWTNRDCPFAQKHYRTGNMQKQQAEAAQQDVVWLSVMSSAPGKEGYMLAPAVRAWKASVGSKAMDVLLDPSGTVGKAYGARTTPDMYIIDKDGKLAYMGGIDNRPSAWLGQTDRAKQEIAEAKPYVKMALADLAAGRPVATPVTVPYGCTVKYSDSFD